MLLIHLMETLKHNTGFRDGYEVQGRSMLENFLPETQVHVFLDNNL